MTRARRGSRESDCGGDTAARANTAPRVAVGEAFTPTQPKTGRRRMVGRDVELRRIIQAFQEDHAHVVLYSERGRGKTSLANLVVASLRRTGIIVGRHTCEAGTTFDTLLRGLMRDLPPALLAGRTNANGEGCEAALPEGPLTPQDIVALPQRLACRSLVCVVDEFDRVGDADTRTRLADTIKQLSDRHAPLLFLIVGVSENLDMILGQHPSIQRTVMGVHLPLFTDRDVSNLIAKGGQELGLVFEPAAIARILVLARGMPYMAQLLGLRLAQAAASRQGSNLVLEEDFDTAVIRLLDDASTRVLALYDKLTNHGRDTAMSLALRRIAGAPQDAWARILVDTPEASALETSPVIVGGREVPLICWQRLLAAGVLIPAQSALADLAHGAQHEPDLFVFAERPLMHHVLLLAARSAALPAAIQPDRRQPEAAKFIGVAGPSNLARAEAPVSARLAASEVPMERAPMRGTPKLAIWRR